MAIPSDVIYTTAALAAPPPASSEPCGKPAHTARQKSRWYKFINAASSSSLHVRAMDSASPNGPLQRPEQNKRCIFAVYPDPTHEASKDVGLHLRFPPCTGVSQ